MGVCNRHIASTCANLLFDKFGNPDPDKKTTNTLKHESMKEKNKDKKSENLDKCMKMKSSSVVDGLIGVTRFNTLTKEETTEFSSPMNTLDSVSHESNKIINSDIRPKQALMYPITMRMFNRLLMSLHTKPR